MKNSINKAIKFSLIFLVSIGLFPTILQAQLPSCDFLLDDFSGDSLDLDEWNTPESSRYLSAGKLNISQTLISRRSRTTYRDTQRFHLYFNDGLRDDIGAKVALTKANVSASGDGLAFASIQGAYYNSENNDPDNQIGDIFAEVNIGDTGDGLEAWYVIVRSDNEDFSEWSVLTDEVLIAPGTLQLNTEYDLRIELISTSTFRFTANGVQATADGPAAVSTSGFSSWRRLSASAIPEDSADSAPISVAATFDDVKTDGVLFDSFSGNEINQANWDGDKARRFLANGKLANEIRSQSNQKHDLVNYPNFAEYADVSCLQATLNLQSSSTIPSGTRGRVRTEGYWYNNKYNSSTGYNGVEGNVWAQLVIQKDENGDMYAYAYAEQVDDADYNSYTTILDQGFSTPVSLDTDYNTVIKLDRTNKRLQFRFANEVINMPITTNIFPSWPEEDYVGIRTRVNFGPGEIHSLIDDIFTTPSSFDDDDFLLLLLPAIINGANSQ